LGKDGGKEATGVGRGKNKGVGQGEVCREGGKEEIGGHNGRASQNDVGRMEKAKEIGERESEVFAQAVESGAGGGIPGGGAGGEVFDGVGVDAYPPTVVGVLGKGKKGGDGAVSVDAAAIATRTGGAGGIEREVGEVRRGAPGRAKRAVGEDGQGDGVVEVEAKEVVAGGGTEPAFGQGDGGSVMLEADGEVELGPEDGAEGGIVPGFRFLGSGSGEGIGGKGDADAEDEAVFGGVLGTLDEFDGMGEGLGGRAAEGAEFFEEDFGGEVGGEAADGGGSDFDADEAVAGRVNVEERGFAAGFVGGGVALADEVAVEELARGIGDGAPGQAGAALEIGARNGGVTFDGAEDGEKARGGHGVLGSGERGVFMKIG
jgi:hypothetical protein